MLSHQRKLLLFRSLSQAAESQISEVDLFLNLAQHGPAVLREQCEQAAILVKKNNAFAVAGLKAGLFSSSESKALNNACEYGRLLAALRTFGTYYEIRTSRRPVSRLVAPYAFLLLFAILVAPAPAIYQGNIGVMGYLLCTVVPTALLIFLFWLVNYPHGFIRSKVAQDLGIPKLMLKLPTISQRIITKEMDSFLEYTGMLKLCGYDWKAAIEGGAEKVTHPAIQQSLGVIIARLQRRDTFADALKACEYFPEDYIPVLHAAEKAQQLPAALIRFKATEIIKTAEQLKSDLSGPIKVLAGLSIVLFAAAAVQLL